MSELISNILNKKRKTKTIVITAMLGAMSFAGVAQAADTLRFAEFGPNRGWRSVVHKWVAEQAQERSKGEVLVKSTFGGALLKSRTVLRGVGRGLADLGTIVGVYTPAQLVNYRVGDIPTGNDDPYVGMSAVYELATTHPVLKAEFDKQNVVYIGNFSSSTVLLACKKPVTKLSDLDGLKIRANPPHSDVFNKFGAVIVAMPFPEVYQALDKGIIDCAQTYWTAIYAYKHHEVAKHITSLNWSQNMGFGVVMNKDKFNKLKPAQQKMIKELGRDMTNLAAKVTIGSTAKLKKKIGEDASVTIHQLDAQAQKDLIKAGLETGKSFKGDPAVLKAYLAAVKKYENVKTKNGYPWNKKTNK